MVGGLLIETIEDQQFSAVIFEEVLVAHAGFDVGGVEDDVVGSSVSRRARLRGFGAADYRGSDRRGEPEAGRSTKSQKISALHGGSFIHVVKRKQKNAGACGLPLNEGDLLVQKIVLTQQVGHDAAPGAERVMRVVETLAVNPIAGIAADLVQSLF